jgi:hypothetical protein
MESMVDWVQVKQTQYLRRRWYPKERQVALGKLQVTDWPATRSCTLADEKRGTEQMRFGRLRNLVVATLLALQLSWAGRVRRA